MAKMKWNKADLAAQRVVNDLLTTKGLNNHEVERLTHKELSYNRLRAARVGVGTPFRVGELILIFRVCHVDPVTEWLKILSIAGVTEKGKSNVGAGSAHSLQQASSLLDHANSLIKQSINTIETQPPSDYVLMADYDPNRDAEADTPDE